MDFTINFWVSLYWISEKFSSRSLSFFGIHPSTSTMPPNWVRERAHGHGKGESGFLCAFCAHIFDGASMLARLPELRESRTLYNREESAFKSHRVGWLRFCSMPPCSLGLTIQVLWSPFPHLRSERFDPAHLQGPFPPPFLRI